MTTNPTDPVAAAEVPTSHPMRAAWETYRATDDYANTRRWAMHDAYADGSMWAAFCAGYQASRPAFVSEWHAKAVTLGYDGVTDLLDAVERGEPPLHVASVLAKVAAPVAEGAPTINAPEIDSKLIGAAAQDLFTRLRALLEQATPGPWQPRMHGSQEWLIDAPNGDAWLGYSSWAGMVAVCGSDDSPEEGAQVASANAELIAAAVNALPALLAELDRLRAVEEDGTAEQVYEVLHRFGGQPTAPSDDEPTLPTLRGFKGLHHDTLALVRRFAYALACKLAMAEQKYGYTDDWKRDDWMDECRAKLIEHLGKGDPRDVAAYCMFLWHHDQPTAAPSERWRDADMWVVCPPPELGPGFGPQRMWTRREEAEDDANSLSPKGVVRPMVFADKPTPATGNGRVVNIAGWVMCLQVIGDFECGADAVLARAEGDDGGG